MQEEFDWDKAPATPSRLEPEIGLGCCPYVHFLFRCSSRAQFKNFGTDFHPCKNNGLFAS